MIASGALLPLANSLAENAMGRGQPVGLYPSLAGLRSRQEPASAAESILLVEENQGQYEDRIQFLINAPGAMMPLTNRGLWIIGRSMRVSEPDTADQPDGAVMLEAIEIRFPGVSGHLRAEGFLPVESNLSYILGPAPLDRHPDVPLWGALRLKAVAPSYDLEIEGQDGSWGWTFVERDGGSQVLFGLFGASGPEVAFLEVRRADALIIEEGAIVATVGSTDFRLPFPQVESSSGQIVSGLADPSVDGNEITVPLKPR